MTGPAPRPEGSGEPTLDGPSTEELDRSDMLLDQLAAGEVDLTVERTPPGELAALTLLRTAADPSAPTDSGAAPAFIAAVRHRAPEHAGHKSRRWGRLVGTTLAVKVAIVAALSVLGVAAAGATGGLVREVLTKPDIPPTTSLADHPDEPMIAGGGANGSRVSSAVPPPVRLLDEATLDLLRSTCATPGGASAAIVRTLAERSELTPRDTCAAVERESGQRRAADDAGAAAPRDSGASDLDETGSTPADRAHDGGGTGSDRHGGGNPQGGQPGNPNPSGSANAGGNNPNSNGAANQGRSPSAGGNPNPGGGNPNAGNPNPGGGNPNAGNPNQGGGNPNAGNPNQGGGNPNPGNPNPGNPNQGGGNPNPGNPNPGGGNPNPGNPNPGGGNPNAANPNAGSGPGAGNSNAGGARSGG